MDFKAAKKYVLTRLEQELAGDLYYHGTHHTLDVYHAAQKLLQMEKVNRNDELLALTAALYHDVGFIFKYENNEILAVKLAKEALPNFDYTPQEINTICQIILSTRSNVIPNTLLEEIICDADHDYLGRDDVKEIANTLYLELQEYETPFSKIEWNKIQLQFLEEHQYYSHSAITLRQKNKQDYMNYLKQLT